MKKTKLSSLKIHQKKLVDLCLTSRKKAYAPYSNFKVGAVAVSSTGKTFPGCNIESADYTLTTHAEMTAINNMVLAGETELDEIYIALESLAGGKPVPCGLCRQKMHEFAGPKTTIYGIALKNGQVDHILVMSLKELLPLPFSKSNFKKG